MQPSAPDAPARARRRAPADLPFTFADQELADALATQRDEPDWLRDERLAALAAFEALPVESNQLYTTYVDLRAAILDEVQPWTRTASAPEPGAATGLADDIDALIELREDTVVSLGLSPAAT